MDKDQKITLLVAVTTAFLTSYMGSALNLSIPGIETHFGVGTASVGWVVTAYMLSVSAFNVPMGKIADVRGRRAMLILGIGIFSAAGAGAAFSVNIAMLLIMRVLQGLGAAMLFATNNAVLLAGFPEEKHGTVLGISVASTYTGLSLGPVLGGIINKHFGWQAVFITSALVGIAAFFIAARGLKKTEERAGGRISDLSGSIVYIAMIVCVIYGLTDLSVHSYAKFILIGGSVLGILFVKLELGRTDPVLKIDLFRDRIVAFSNIAALLNYGSTVAIGYLLSIYLQAVKGFDSQAAGLLLIAQPVVMAVISPRTGRLSDRIPAYKLASLGMAMCAAGLGLLTMVKEDTSLIFIVATQVFLGVGFAFFSSPNTKAIMDRVSQQDYGIANSILATMRNVGHSTGMGVVTIVVGIMIGSASLESTAPATIVSSMHVVFLINVVLCLAGTILSMFRSKE